MIVIISVKCNDRNQVAVTMKVFKAITAVMEITVSSCNVVDDNKFILNIK